MTYQPVRAHVPPRKHLRKAAERLVRYEAAAAAVHPYLAGDASTPDRHVRRRYLEAYEIVMTDYERLLNDLIEGRGGEGEE